MPVALKRFAAALLVFILGMVLIYNFYVKRLIDKRLLERTKKYITRDFQHCQELWNFGGLIIATAANKKLGCISPEGDCLNLKSKLCRYIAFAELFVNDNEVIKELELKTEEPEDTERFIDFMMREG